MNHMNYTNYTNCMWLYKRSLFRHHSLLEKPVHIRICSFFFDFVNDDRQHWTRNHKILSTQNTPKKVSWLINSNNLNKFFWLKNFPILESSFFEKIESISNLSSNWVLKRCLKITKFFNEKWCFFRSNVCSHQYFNLNSKLIKEFSF